MPFLVEGTRVHAKKEKIENIEKIENTENTEKRNSSENEMLE